MGARSASLIVMLLVLMSVYLVFATGIGVWGRNSPSAGRFDITNFVFWVGIGHAGTLISAILFLFRQKWRTSINRFAEAMTIFAVSARGSIPMPPRRPADPGSTGCSRTRTRCACGRTSAARWCGTSSRSARTRRSRSSFWYIGLIPDLATLRDRGVKKARA